VGSQASGTISALYADFNSVVKKGQVVAQLDPSTAKAQVEQARANLEQARATLANARAAVLNSRAGVSDAQARGLAARSTVQNNQAGVSGAEANVAVLKAQQDDALSLLKQQESLLKAGVIAQRDYDVSMTAYKTAEARYNQAVSQLQQAKVVEQSSSSAGIAQSQAAVAQSQAQVQQSESSLKQLEEQLSYTTITAAQDGRVVNLTAAVGQYAQAGTNFSLFVPDELWVIANFKETQLSDMRPSQPATMRIDAYPNRVIHGHVDSVQPGSGTAFSLLPAQNATGNYVKIVQRVPVKIVMDNAPPDVALGPGMSVVPVVRVRPGPSLYERLLGRR